MRITTIEEARALVGRTFERDGKRRKIVNIAYSLSDGEPWRVIWHSGDTDRVGSMVDKFNDWLSGATEIVTQ